jgi:hypothetical protein
MRSSPTSSGGVGVVPEASVDAAERSFWCLL